MERMNSFYRAFKAYKELVGDNKSIVDFRDALKKSSSKTDNLTSIRTYAIVDEDWVQTIETEMFYVEKAIREDRQFIRQNGEVLPIEKVKKVSPHSVKHLAKHSELISKESNENEDVIPESLYVVENLTDYAVYENRFLYMLLNYVRDFLTIRLDKILELGMTHKSNLTVKKDVTFNRRHFTVETKMFDENKKDAYSSEFGNSGSMVHRIQDQLGMVMMLLNTPLMVEVSKVPMLKPPITKTNVLRMNNNFRHALELYHYLVTYDKLGYEIKEIKNVIAPFSERFGEEYSDILLMSSMLSYQHGNKITELLHSEYLKEEDERKSKEDEIVKKRLKDLKARLEKTGKGLDDYIIALENRNRDLEADRTKNVILNEKNKQLNIKIENLNTEIKDNLDKIDELNAQVESWIKKYQEDLSNLKAEYEQKIVSLTADYENAIAELKQAFENEVVNINQEWQEKYDQTVKTYEDRVSEIRATLSKERENYYVERESILSSNKACGKQIDQLIWRNNLLNGELTALRSEHGLIAPTEDFTEKHRFKELETEFEAFTVLFKTEWEKTKRRIKKEILSVYPQKQFKKLTDDADLVGNSLKDDNTFKEETVNQDEENKV